MEPKTPNSKPQSAMTRWQRRQLRKIADCLGKITDGDRLFFERHPQRTFRVRHAADCEVTEWETALGHPVPLPPGIRLFVAVRRLAPGVRARIHFAADDIAETDIPEAVAERVFLTMARGQSIVDGKIVGGAA